MVVNLEYHTGALLMTIFSWFATQIKLDRLRPRNHNIFRQLVIDADRKFYTWKNFIQIAIIVQVILLIL